MKTLRIADNTMWVRHWGKWYVVYDNSTYSPLKLRTVKGINSNGQSA